VKKIVIEPKQLEGKLGSSYSLKNA